MSLLNNIHIIRIGLLLLLCSFLDCQRKQNAEHRSETIRERLVLPPPPKPIDENSLVGFACFYSGRSSKPVERVTKILKAKNYTALKDRICGTSPAEKYLSTVACERLHKMGLIEFSNEDLDQIVANKSSNEAISICGGCTGFQKLTLKEMFISDKNFLSNSVKDWLQKTIP